MVRYVSCLRKIFETSTSLLKLGVNEVVTNVDAKTVDVQCEDGVNNQTLLESLQKWSATSGKSVELLN
jgi:hypothetical protein